MALQKLSDELENVKMHLALNEDLTGFSVVSVKSEQMGEVYNCILNDCLGQTASALILDAKFYATNSLISLSLMSQQASHSSSPSTRTRQCHTSPTWTPSETPRWWRSSPSNYRSTCASRQKHALNGSARYSVA